MAISVSLNGENFGQVVYSKEDAFEQLVAQNAQTIFGDKAIYIDAKRKINKSGLGETIPDGFLIDLSDPDDPQFYLVEVELQSHDFLRHILPQITKFFDFYSSPWEQQRLTGQIFSILKEDSTSGKKIRDLIGTNETYKFLKDTLENSQNILIIIDGLKPEFEKMMNTHKDTWGKMVKVQIVNHFRLNDKNILTVEPPFQNLPFEDAVSPPPDKETSEPSQYTEKFHLERCSTDVKDIYGKLKNTFLNIESTLKFDSVKSYVGVRNNRRLIACIYPQKKKILLVTPLSEDEMKIILASDYHKIKVIPSNVTMVSAVEISNTGHWDEIEKLVTQLVEKYQDT
jgi:predicted transport protein